LLGALTGEADDSGIGLQYEEPMESVSTGEEAVFSPEDSQTIEAMEETFKESQDLEIQLDAPVEDEMPAPAEDAAEEPSLDLEDLIFDDAEAAKQEIQEDAEDDIVSLDIDEPSGDETEIVLDEEAVKAVEVEDTEMPTGLQDTSDKKEQDSLDLGDVSIEDLELEKEVDMESAQEEEEMAADLDNLLLDESGEKMEREKKHVPLDTAEMITSEIDLKKLNASEDMEDLNLDLEIEELDDKPS
jgi:hypothetical protein